MQTAFFLCFFHLHFPASALYEVERDAREYERLYRHEDRIKDRSSSYPV
jgi:hypothetical protein